MTASYQDIADRLAGRIAAGEWCPGEAMPTVTELAAQYGTAQSTILSSIEELYRRHLVAPAARQQYVVRPRPPAQRLANERFGARPASGLGGHYVDFATAVPVRVDVERIELEPDPPVAVTEILGTAGPCLLRHRTYYAQDIPTQVATSYVPMAVAGQVPELWRPDTGPGGMYARFRELGHDPLQFEEELSARPPTATERAALQLPRGTAVVEMTRTVRGPNDVLEACLILLSADQYTFRYRWVA